MQTNLTGRHALRAAIVLAAAAATATGLLPALPTPPAHAAPAPHADDFNGDGIRDYASWVNWSEQAGYGGAVRITFGTPSGPGTRTQLVHQGSRGVPGRNEADDQFGRVRASADFNGDGYADLAVASPMEKVDGRENQGWVTVLWGGPSGLSGGTTIPNRNPRAYGGFGSDLATGDFNGDGRADLAAVNSFETYVYRGRIDRSGVAGSVTMLDREDQGFYSESLIAGRITKDRATDLVILGTTGVDVRFVTDAWFVRGGRPLHEGRTLRIDSRQEAEDAAPDGVIADFDQDGYGDVAIGARGEADGRGEVTVWYGGSDGPGSSTRLTQATAGIAGIREPEDLFGCSLSAGDANGDGYPDLAVGSYGEKINGEAGAGIVYVLRGGSNGLTGRGSQAFHRDTPGVPGDIGPFGDHFGEVVRLRADRDAYDDLYVYGYDDASVRLRGSPGGITTDGATTPADPGLVDGMLQ
ncbi:FG-GAP and VCBS repeat-containing protein [Streptomyces sp. 4N509B]|uniref:FG-GAP and VCBS repeat-containing protein n=1 Tax=Streptomyces sp. 4N509B TaxID=3457413 RepID=UPI003FD31C64